MENVAYLELWISVHKTPKKHYKIIIMENWNYYILVEHWGVPSLKESCNSLPDQTVGEARNLTGKYESNIAI